MTASDSSSPQSPEPAADSGVASCAARPARDGERRPAAESERKAVIQDQATKRLETPSSSAETQPPVQGELDLQPASPIPAEIEVEFHGRRVGLSALIESLLFVADAPVEANHLARALDVSRPRIDAGLARLAALYTHEERGLRLQERDDMYQIVTMPAAAQAIEAFLNLDLSTRLSGPALETLAIVAYRQPVTRSQVEAVRGVDCAGVLRSLQQRGLIEDVGRLETVGRPILYGVSDLFMQHFGLLNLSELPALEEAEADALWAASELAEEEGDDVSTRDARKLDNSI